jgi:hypothetical protein
MPLAQRLSPRAWYDRAVELSWHLLPGPRLDPVTLTWPVAAERLRDVVVRWPRTYQWRPRRIWGDQIVAALKRFARVRPAEIAQSYDHVIRFEVEIGGRRHPINIETSDYPELNEEAYRDSALHFKMEYSLAGYGARDHLLPGGYVNADAAIYRYLGRLRAMRDRLPPLYEVYGRYGLSMEKRRRPLEILRASRAFRFEGGEGKARYSRYLREVARARICIDLPSMSSITFRCVDFFAIGTCIVGPPHTNQLLQPFQEGVHAVYCKPDYSDLEEVCAGLLREPERQRELVHNTRAFFDATMHREQLASYYLHHIVDRLN